MGDLYGFSGFHDITGQELMEKSFSFHFSSLQSGLTAAHLAPECLIITRDVWTSLGNFALSASGSLWVPEDFVVFAHGYSLLLCG